jgi:hypothetical protein
MTVTGPARRRAAPLCAVQTLAATVFAAALLPAQGALAQGFNPYSSFTDSGPVTPEEKARLDRRNRARHSALP